MRLARLPGKARGREESAMPFEAGTAARPLVRLMVSRMARARAAVRRREVTLMRRMLRVCRAVTESLVFKILASSCSLGESQPSPAIRQTGARPTAVAPSTMARAPCKAATSAIGRGAAKATSARTTFGLTTAVRSDEARATLATTATRRRGPSSEVWEARVRLPSTGRGETRARTTTTTRTEKRLFSTVAETSGPIA